MTRGFAIAPPAAAALSCTCPAAHVQDVAITGATLMPSDGSEPVANGPATMRGGRITAVGASVRVPAGVAELDDKESCVTPHCSRSWPL